jgi:hypothetical protein
MILLSIYYIYTIGFSRNCPHTVVWYASPDHDRKSSLGRWTNTISGLGLVLFPPNINPIIVSNALNIPRGTVSDVVVRFKRRGSVENKPHTGRHRLLDERDTVGLVRLVRSDRKTPLKDVTTRFNENRETQVSNTTVRFPLILCA